MPVIVSIEELYEEQKKDELKTLERDTLTLKKLRLRLGGVDKTIYRCL